MAIAARAAAEKLCHPPVGRPRQDLSMLAGTLAVMSVWVQMEIADAGREPEPGPRRAVRTFHLFHR